MDVPDELKYTNEHEWVKVIDEEHVKIGLTDYAQNALGDIVYVELPRPEDEFEKDDAIGVVESSKTTSDIYAPVSGRVVEINEALEDSPEIINEDPYGDGWLVKMKLFDPAQMDELMSAGEYDDYIRELIEKEE